MFDLSFFVNFALLTKSDEVNDLTQTAGLWSRLVVRSVRAGLFRLIEIFLGNAI